MSDVLPTDRAEEAPTLSRVIRALLEPASSVGAATQRRKARLLATFLCILFVVFGLVDVVGVLFVPGH
ncbi:MAG: hypothetical protein ACHP85_25870, partial [Burkholderiales bacterium]